MKKIILMILFAISAVFGAEQIEGSWRQISKYDASNDEVFGVHGQNHFVFGVDTGYGIEVGHDLEFVIPISVRAGYLRDIGKDWAVSANLTYNKMGITRPFHRLGGEVSGYYKVTSGIWFYLGVGILKDVNPSTIYATKTEYSYPYNYKTIKYEIDLWYPVVKLGMLWNFNEYIGATMDLNCTWDVQDVSYLGIYFGLGFGLQFKI